MNEWLGLSMIEIEAIHTGPRTQTLKRPNPRHQPSEASRCPRAKVFKINIRWGKQKEGGYEDAVISCFQKNFGNMVPSRGHTALPPDPGRNTPETVQRVHSPPKTGPQGPLLHCFPDTYPLGGCYTALKKKSCPGSMCRQCSHIQSVGEKMTK